MHSTWGLVLLSTCVFASPLPYSHLNYYQPNPFIEKDAYDYPLFEPASKPINNGFYYAQVQPQPQRNPEIAQAHPLFRISQQRPYPLSQQYHPTMVLNYGHNSNLPNQIHPGGNRVQEIQPHHQDVYSPDVGAILSQFVNGFREQVQQQGNIGIPQPSFSAIQITPNGNGNQGAVKEITAIVYNSETGAVKEVPALVYSSSAVAIAGGPQVGPGSLVSAYPQNLGQPSVAIELQDSTAQANPTPCQNGGEKNHEQEDAQSAEDFIAAENASPEPTPEGISEISTEDSKPKPENTPSQEEINKKYPVKILTPDSTASSDNSDSNTSTDREAPPQVTETSKSPETTIIVPLDAASITTPSGSISDNIGSSSTSSTTTTVSPPESETVTENLNMKDVDGETTVSDVESPTPK